MRAAGPNVVLADTPYLAVAAGKSAAIPTVALISFTWDLVLSEYIAPPSIDSLAILQLIRQTYAQADLALRITPAPKMEIFQRIVDIGPIAEPAPSAREQLSEFLGLSPGEQTVLVGFGGVPLDSLPFHRLELLTGYRFIFDGSIPPGTQRFVATASLPFSFKTLMASVDLIMTKPGYGIIAECIANDTALIYTSRGRFVEYDVLVREMPKYLRAAFLSNEDLYAGRWQDALDAVVAQEDPAERPRVDGAEVVAGRIAAVLGVGIGIG